MLWGATLRSPHPHARIVSIDTTAALTAPGVFAVLTHADVPGKKTFGLDVQDQPVLATDVVRYAGEAVAIVAAEDPELARAALKKIIVKYEVLTPVTDMERALARSAPPVNPPGKVVRILTHVHGDPWPHVVLYPPLTPPPIARLDAPRRGSRRNAGHGPGSAPSRWRRLHLDLPRRDRQRHHLCRRAVRGSQRTAGGHRGLHQQPALWGDAWLRGRASVFCLRGADGQAGRGAESRSDRAAHQKRIALGLGA